MKKENLTQSLKELENIVNWFEDQEEVDIEEALQKVKQGAALIKSSKKRLSEIENEFQEVQESLEEGE